MAQRIQAFTEYGPKVDLQDTVEKDNLEEYIQDRTGLNKGEIHIVLDEFNDAIIFFAKQGISVKVDGLGRFRPTIHLDGSFDVQVSLDRSIRKAMNVAGAFTGNVLNRESIGSSMDELIQRWNVENPDDLIE